MKTSRILILVTALLCVPALAGGTLQISPNGRYLVDENGKPFLLTGDSAWSLIAQPDLPDARLYLQDRADRGFNLVAVTLVEHQFASNPPANAAGDLPFTGAPFTTPNEAYFAHADSVLNYAAALDIVVLLSPVYLGWICGDEGWCQEIQNTSLAGMREWGRYVGNRYQGLDNIIWIIGGDADPTPVADKLREFVQGLREFDSTSLITAHNHRDTQAITYWPGESWLQVNNVFATRTALYQSTGAGYTVTPTMPFFLLEAFYENEHNATEQQLRAQSYWTVLTGAFGLVFGNCPIWLFGYSSSWCSLTGWKSELAQPGSTQMTYYRALFESRRWETLVPDFDNLVLTSGAGTAGSETWATAALASDGSSIIAYTPTPRALVFDTTGLTGENVRAWWYDPSNGEARLIGDFPGGTVSIPASPPGDWVIVLDDAALGFLAPGTPIWTPAPSAIDPGVRLHQNDPNPFNPSTVIRFDVARAGRVEVTIFNAAGRMVRQLLDRIEEPGPHSVAWDGRDENGRSMGSGLYVYRLRTATGSVSRKMILLK